MQWSQAEIESYLGQAKKEMNEKQILFTSGNHISTLVHSKYTENDNTIEFCTDEGKTINCNFIPVGTLARITNNWLWAWNNKIYSRRIKKPFSIIRKFGLKHSIVKLQVNYWEGSHKEAMLMTAVMCKLIKGKGVYIKTGKKVDLYLVLTTVVNEKAF